MIVIAFVLILLGREIERGLKESYVVFIDFAEHKDLLNVNNGTGALAAGQISSKLLELLEIFRSFG